MMKVPLLDLKGQYDTIRDEILPAIEELLETQSCCNGPVVRTLEKELADYSGCRRGIGVSSGTDALLASLMALGIGAGDEVIIPTFTFFATAGVVWRTGATPVFADIEADTFNLDPRGIKRLITSKTKAILPVHLYGQIADMDPIREVAKAHGLSIIEDAAQSIGAEYKGLKCGAFGDSACYSFYPTKNLGAMGDAGCIVTNSHVLAEKIESFRNHGQGGTYMHHWVGGNFRMDSIQAVVLSIKLKKLDAWAETRRRYASIYEEVLSDVDGLTLPVVKDYSLPVWHQYVIRSHRRDDLKAFLQEKEIASGIYYPLCLHLQDCFSELGGSEGDHPVAEKASSEVLALPISSDLSEEQIRYVAASIREF